MEKQEPNYFDVLYDDTSSTVQVNAESGGVDNFRIDQHQYSLFLDSEDGVGGLVSVDLPFDVIESKKMDGTDDIWIVLADDYQIDYLEEKTSTSSVLSFSVPPNTEQLQIIGTTVVPEFPLTYLVLMTSMVIIIIAGPYYTKKQYL